MKMNRSKPWAATLSHDVDEVIDDVVPLDGDDAGKIHVVGVEGVGHHRQHQQFVRGAPARGVAEPGDDEVVGVERQVVAVLLGGADRLDDDRLRAPPPAAIRPRSDCPNRMLPVGEFHVLPLYPLEVRHPRHSGKLRIAAWHYSPSPVARGFAPSVLRQPVGAIQPLALLVAEGQAPDRRSRPARRGAAPAGRTARSSSARCRATCA